MYYLYLYGYNTSLSWDPAKRRNFLSFPVDSAVARHLVAAIGTNTTPPSRSSVALNKKAEDIAWTSLDCRFPHFPGSFVPKTTSRCPLRIVEKSQKETIPVGHRKTVVLEGEIIIFFFKTFHGYTFFCKQINAPRLLH